MNHWKNIFINYKISLLFLIASIVFILSLLSYNEADPSFNLATSISPNNWLSYPGAYFADLLYQFFGLSAWLFPCCFVIWLLRTLRGKEINWLFMRSICLILAIIFLNIALSELKFITLQNDGGVINIFFKYLMNLYFDQKSFSVLIFIIANIASIVCFIIASSISFKDYYRLTIILVKLPISLIGKTGLPQKALQRINNLDNQPAYYAQEELNIDHQQNNLNEVANSTTTNKILSKTRYPHNKATPLNIKDNILPILDLLNDNDQQNIKPQSNQELQLRANKLLTVLKDFGVKGQINTIREGPVVTMYELEPAAGTKSSRIIGLADDIARSLSAISARISVMAGKNALGIELPNKQRAFFKLKELLQTQEFKNPNILLPIILGKDLAGRPLVADLAKMPHLLVAGTTGSGKSVAINTMIMSLLYRYTPEECRMIMIDPKMLELSAYDNIPHLMTPVVTEPGKAIVALKWAVKEMENRYRLMSHLGVRNIAGYNSKLKTALAKGEIIERKVQTGFDPETGQPIFDQIPIEMKNMPFIVVVVDEMADLMLVAGKDIEASIQRLAQMARAAGIHIIMATQRPSVDVITGVIKANFPSRISFRVTSKIDSRTILGEQGAEQLLGMGDMLYMGNSSRTLRVHGPFVDDGEVERVTNFLRSTRTPEYISAVTEDDEDSELSLEEDNIKHSEDSLFGKAVDIVKRDRKTSISYIQRSLRIGYNRAANLVEELEKQGILSPPNQAGKRDILLPD